MPPILGTIEVDLGGKTSGYYDKFAVSGAFTAAGTLTVRLINGFTPADGDTFDILDFGSVSGAFTATNLPGSPANWNTTALYSTGEIQYVMDRKGTVVVFR